ncbi:MFS transporter [Spirillospora sp. CA-108201]
MHAASARRASTPPPVRNETGAGPAGPRLGVLFGPAVFGVTAAGVALPEVAASLGAAPDDVAWVLTVHALALGVGTALFGRLADARGVRTTLLSGSLVLGLGAVVILLAPNLGVLVAGRFVLAAGSGAMTSGALSLAGVPLCLRLAVRPGSGRRMDPVGAGLVTAAAATLLVFVQSPTLSLPAWAVASAGLAFLPAAACLAWWVRTRPEGFVLRSVVADRAFVLAAAIGVGVYSGLFAVMYALPQILVEQQDWSVLSVGKALLPGAADRSVPRLRGVRRHAGRHDRPRVGAHRTGPARGRHGPPQPHVLRRRRDRLGRRRGPVPVDAPDRRPRARGRAPARRGPPRPRPGRREASGHGPEAGRARQGSGGIIDLGLGGPRASLGSLGDLQTIFRGGRPPRPARPLGAGRRAPRRR